MLPPTSEPHWTLRPQLPEGDAIPVRDFNRHLNAKRPAWASSPLLIVVEFLQLGQTEAATTSISLQRIGGVTPSRAVADIVTEGLFDDSIAAQSFKLNLRRKDDGTWRVTAASWAQRCHPGRGQQTFTLDYCV